MSKRHRLQTAPAGNAPVGFQPDHPRWPLAIVVALVTFAAFLPALGNGFVKWDDDVNFLLNPDYRGLGWTQLKWMFTTFHAGPYQPLCWVSYGLDYVLWGMNPGGYHLTNNLLHACNAVLLYYCGIRLLQLAVADTENDRTGISLAAAFAALVYAVHPLRVESVAWVTERKDVLSGSFFLLTILLYLQAGAAPASRRPRLLAFAWGAYLAALLSKGIVVTLPLVLVLLDIYPLRRLSGPSEEWLAPAQRPLWAEKIPFLSMALVFGIVGVIGQARHAELRPLETYGLAARLAQACFGMAFYLGKTLAPWNLLPLYELPRRFHPYAPQFLFSAAVVLALGIGLFRMRRRWPAGLAAGAYYVVTLLPVLGIIQFGLQLAADRYTYLPSMGWALVIGGGLLALRRWRRTGIVSVASRVLAVACVAGLAAMTWRQSLIWRDTETLWRHALSVDPGIVVAHNNLGLELSDQGKLDEAIAHYLQALKIDPLSADAHNNLGRAWLRRERWDDAIYELREAVRINPRHANAYNNLGSALAHKGQWDEALASYRQALAVDPGNVTALTNWGDALAGQSRYDEALERYRQALRIKPGHVDAYNNMGAVMIKQGRLSEGVLMLQEALRNGPDDATAHFNLATALLNQGRQDEAVEHYRAVLRIDPQHKAARRDLGLALARKGDWGEVLGHLRGILQADPRDADAHFSLANILAGQGRLDEAIGHYHEALGIDPRHGEARNNLGVALIHQGRWNEAIEQFRAALRVRPADALAKDNLEKALEHLRQGRPR